MKNINEQLVAIEVMKAEFLRFFNGQAEASPGELKARHERIKAALDACGGSMDAYWVAWLFGELEQRANDELRKLVALARTAEPEKLKGKYFSGLNEKLVDDVAFLHRYLKKTTQRRATNKAVENKMERENEVIYRAKFFIENPEPKYKGKVENYRSSTLAKAVVDNWKKPVRVSYPSIELWKNSINFDAPKFDKVVEYIKAGAKRGELPAYVVNPKKPSWK